MRIILHTKIPNNLSFVFWIFAPKMAKSANVTLIFDAKSNQFFGMRLYGRLLNIVWSRSDQIRHTLSIPNR